jgi:hypothetical protein
MAQQARPRLDVWRNELIWAHSQALWTHRARCWPKTSRTRNCC